MSALFKLREWLTVPEAAQHLSREFDEPVTAADVLRLALDGHLRLSVNFLSEATIRLGATIPSDAVIQMDPESILYDTVRIDSDTEPDGQKFIKLDDGVNEAVGVWDLSMLGGERVEVARELQRMISGPGPKMKAPSPTGIILKAGNDTFAQLQAPANPDMADQYPLAWRPEFFLPDDSVLVVRPVALDDFITRTANAAGDAEPTKGPWPWGDYETELLLHLQKTVAKWWARYDPSDHTTAPTKQEVVDWLMDERKLTKNQAAAIAMILRADNLPSGPRR